MPVTQMMMGMTGPFCVCPYCGYAVSGLSMDITPTVPDGEGLVDPSEAVLESRCTRCGGGFALASAPARRHVAPPTEGLDDLMESLDIIESAVRDYSPAMGRHPRQMSGVWGREVRL